MSGAGQKGTSTSVKLPVESWLNVSETHEAGIYKTEFAEHHIGNPVIRSMHGGVVGSLLEYTAEKHLENHLADTGIKATVELFTSSIEYLRVTKDAPLYARAQTIRIARRVAFIDVYCWQDEEDMPVSKASCTLRILKSDSV